MLTDYFLNSGFSFFGSGWTQFGGGFFVAFAIMFLFGRPFVHLMRTMQKKGQPISENVPSAHLQKSGTPTMGGILIMVAILLGSLLFMPMSNPTGWIALAALVMFGLLGFVDDYKKVSSQSKKASNGLSPLTRLVIEGVFVVILAYLINKTMPPYIPEYSLAIGAGIILPLGFLYYVFAYFVICGGANATNITDGLDGMLVKLYIPVLVVLVVALYGATRIGFMDTVMFLPIASGLYAVLGAAFGAVLGFLWYNCKPASIFMGDVGSLALGGFAACIGCFSGNMLYIAVIGICFVLSVISVLLQVIYYKVTGGKRIFLMAPLHHHLQQKGYSETKISYAYGIVTAIIGVISLLPWI